jgi:hypothetical protein
MNMFNFINGHRLLHLHTAEAVIPTDDQYLNLAVPNGLDSRLEPWPVQCPAFLRTIVPDVLIAEVLAPLGDVGPAIPILILE